MSRSFDGAACALLLALAGCYDPKIRLGLPCSDTGGCPTGQVCAEDSTCQLPGGAGDGDAAVIDGDAAPPDARVALEPWLVSFQHPSLTRASGIAHVPGGFLLLGGNGAVVFIDARGDIVWQVELEGVDFATAGGAAGGGFLVGGASGSSTSLTKLDPDGVVLWQKTYADQDGSTPAAVIAIDGTDEVLVVGNSYDAEFDSSPWLLRIDDAGGVVWQRRFTRTPGAYIEGATATEDGGVVVIGNTEAATPTDRDLLVMKVRGDGSVAWRKRIDGGDNEWGSGVVELDSGGLAATGGTWSSGLGLADMWLLRLSADGDIEDQYTIGSAAQDSGQRIFISPLGSLWLVGETADGADGTDLLVVEVDKNDQLAAQRRIGSTENESGAGAAPGNDGLVVFGDSPAFDDAYGFFAAAVVMPDGLPAGCALGKSATMEMMPGSATAAALTLTATTTTAAAIDLAGSATSTGIGRTSECE